MLKYALSICFALLICITPVKADTFDRRFVVNNNTSRDINEIRVRSYNEVTGKEFHDLWQTVAPGSAVVIKPLNTESCKFNLVVLFSDLLIAHKEDVDVCGKFIWEISDDELIPMNDRYDDLE